MKEDKNVEIDEWKSEIQGLHRNGSFNHIFEVHRDNTMGSEE